MAMVGVVTEACSFSCLASRQQAAISTRAEVFSHNNVTLHFNPKACTISARINSRIQDSQIGKSARKHAQSLKPLRLTGGDGSAVAVEDGTATAVEEIPIEKRIPAYPTVFDINKIRELLPHRFPFLLVDRVVELVPGKTVVAIKNVTINDNFFPGHFPERPIMPGVLMIEAMAQVGGIALFDPEVGGSKENFFFAGVDKVRFRKPVVAGDTLVMRMNVVKIQRRYGMAKMEGKAYVGGQVVCEGEFLMALGS
eukprot:TRINITY_DN23747_c0_g1_i2.p1 TRINITY_DN23747_c0_g1~~TRINITY_DN23747_c0_g1_i2.p1  ORF type:complete len:253 (-),score=45.05 TRINITY_DN23747_c0_g1_i2:449-1207(-)